MDYISIDLMNACDLVLNCCKQTDNSWGFEEGSEAHLALVDAVTQARLVLGVDLDRHLPQSGLLVCPLLQNTSRVFRASLT